MKKNTFYTSMKIEILDAIPYQSELPEFKKYLVDNMKYRRKVRNVFIRLDQMFDHDLSSLYNVNWSKVYHNVVEKEDENYNYYITGIRDNEYNENYLTINRVFNERKKGKKSGFHCVKRDMYRESVTFANNKSSTGAYQKISMKNEFTLLFRANKRMHYVIKLKEPIGRSIGMGRYINDKQQCVFENQSMKKISFIRKGRKFYIAIAMEVERLNSQLNKDKLLCAGLDLGIKNPVVLCDGSDIRKYSLSKKQRKRYEYLTRRIMRLQHIMDRKYLINKARIAKGEMAYWKSKSYERVWLKFRIAHDARSNLIKDWRNKLSHKIASSYDILMVDEFSVQDYDKELTESDLCTGSKKRIRHKMAMQSMYLFGNQLKHCMDRMGKIYMTTDDYKVHGTTNTCSKCNHVNIKKLNLSQRTFRCGKCGYEIDRDDNAAVNCLDAIKGVLNSRTFAYSYGTIID